MKKIRAVLYLVVCGLLLSFNAFADETPGSD